MPCSNTATPSTDRCRRGCVSSTADTARPGASVGTGAADARGGDVARRGGHVQAGHVQGVDSGGKRVDAYLVEAGLARSRGVARELLERGAVRVDGHVVVKPSSRLRTDAVVEVEDDSPWVGRGALKLLAALERFEGVAVQGRRCLDIGASTGGFTQVLLSRGAAHVVALDVGHDQLVAQIAADPRVHDLPGTNIRDVSADLLGGPVDLAVGDLSFISLRLVVPVLARLLSPGADVVLLIKPQFEVGRERLGNKGVVRSAQQRREAVRAVVEAAASHGLWARDLMRSPVAGSSGNVEYLGWFTTARDAGLDPGDLQRRIDRLDEGEHG